MLPPGQPHSGRRGAAVPGQDTAGAAPGPRRAPGRSGAAQYNRYRPPPRASVGQGWAAFPPAFITGPGEGSAAPPRELRRGAAPGPSRSAAGRTTPSAPAPFPPPSQAGGGRTNSPRRIVQPRTTFGRGAGPLSAGGWRGRPAAGPAEGWPCARGRGTGQGGSRAGTANFGPLSVCAAAGPGPRSSARPGRCWGRAALCAPRGAAALLAGPRPGRAAEVGGAAEALPEGPAGGVGWRGRSFPRLSAALSPPHAVTRPALLALGSAVPPAAGPGRAAGAGTGEAASRRALPPRFLLVVVFCGVGLPLIPPSQLSAFVIISPEKIVPYGELKPSPVSRLARST